MNNLKTLNGTDYMYYEREESRLQELHDRVMAMREVGKLSPANLRRIRNYFRIKDIYNSNAIEGNQLTIGETRLVVESGITLTGKSLRDQAEAKNLGEVLDFMEEIVSATDRGITLHELRQIHALILRGIDDDNAGVYRKGEVKIAGSEYYPPSAAEVEYKMKELGDYIATVTNEDLGDNTLPILSAAAVHAWLARIHPFVDGNGRSSRILMNLVLMRQGYPICIINRDDRLRYYAALEDSQVGDLGPLISLVYENVEESLEEWEKAAEDQRKETEWLDTVRAKFEAPIRVKIHNEYEVWQRAMALFKSYFKQTVDNLNEGMTLGNSVRLNFRDYGDLGFEKYASLSTGGSAKRTWFFGIEFRRGERRARYLFFFGYPHRVLRNRVKVGLTVAKEVDYWYEPLESITKSNIPNVYQIGFDIEEQNYVTRYLSDVQISQAESIARNFFREVIDRDFTN
ncbi:MAG: Fic family protein [Chloroflexi bacterium]|nr:Fic family protein [Chloroflexota bacterium]MCY4247035.1 Fic family protein [Chloroflexota bacterium]